MSYHYICTAVQQTDSYIYVFNLHCCWGTVLHCCWGTCWHCSLGTDVHSCLDTGEHCWLGTVRHCCLGTVLHCWRGTVLHCCRGVLIQLSSGTFQEKKLSKYWMKSILIIKEGWVGYLCSFKNDRYVKHQYLIWNSIKVNFVDMNIVIYKESN